MPNEHLSNNPESNESAKEDLEAVRAEKLAELNETFSDIDPAQAEKRAESSAEKARETIKQQDAEPEPLPAAEKQSSPISRPLQILDQHLNYSQTLASVQRQLTPVSRSFSKVIHAPVVEKISEALENTVARPSVIAGSIWTALIVGSIFYLIARQYGYSLQGSELLFSFIIGAILGLGVEGIWRLIKHR